jgi:hypothetical protein
VSHTIVHSPLRQTATTYPATHSHGINTNVWKGLLSSHTSQPLVWTILHICTLSYLGQVVYTQTAYHMTYSEETGMAKAKPKAYQRAGKLHSPAAVALHPKMLRPSIKLTKPISINTYLDIK